MKVYYDKDANLGVLKGKKIAIIGYGSQGHAQPDGNAVAERTGGRVQSGGLRFIRVSLQIGMQVPQCGQFIG